MAFHHYINPVTTLLFLVMSSGELCSQNIHAPSSHHRGRNTKDSLNAVYPWRKDVTSTVFWIGEAPAGANKTPNYASSWDGSWTRNYGGYDNPDPKARKGCRPTAFVPKQNPFYVALPYNDVRAGNMHKKEASKVIPWFKALSPLRGRTVLKGKWIQILHDGKSCYAQWEDCGPWTTDDYNYVFKGSKPQNSKNGGAGIDVSPAIRDYLGLRSGEKCHWRFVPFSRIPRGPWSLYGANNPFVNPRSHIAHRVKR